MGFFDKLFGKKEPEAPAAVAAQEAAGVVCAPATGQAMPITDVPDPVFGSGALGKGAGVNSSDGIVYAPVSGTVTAAGAPNFHALGIAGDDGVEVLIHVGVDTVEMKGEGFTVFAKKDSHVKAGEALLKFDKAKVAAAGHPDTVIMAITNTDDYAEVEFVGAESITAGEPIVKVTK